MRDAGRNYEKHEKREWGFKIGMAGGERRKAIEILDMIMGYSS
jgi:hypothetical protein